MSNRDHHAHSADFMAPRYFKKAGRKVYDPLTEIEIPSNYIMLANLSMGCIYEIIELRAARHELDESTSIPERRSV